ncbi:jerky protein homolog-like [Wyeomyia smithii]|uniref:jerky protein homolog-like n=1 Tax=Wyeomyia smithii TaxID=174621 RepID=UPI002467E606|nr:jerky protein homolog-like [Wyeomyia smithii]
MTRQLFRQWFYSEFVPAVRKFSTDNGLKPKALLVLDNCTSHYDVDELLQSDDELIQVIYLPPNVTAECQPMAQAVINAIKRKYKRKLMLALILENDHLSFGERLKKITLQTYISWLATSWEKISDKTMRSSWKKLLDGLSVDLGEENSTADDDDFKALVSNIDNLAGTKTSDPDIDMWINDEIYDADLNPDWVTSEVFTDDEIVSSVLDKDQSQMNENWLEDTTEVSNTFNDSDTNAENPGFGDAIKSVDYLLRYMKHDPAEICRLNALRSKIMEAEWLKRAF